MPVKEISEGHLKQELELAGDKLVLVDFFATWCGPCKMVAPAIEKLSDSHPNAIFLKVDVDKCQIEREAYDISAMPTFVFIRQLKELERIRGADKHAIETALTKHYKEKTVFSGEGHSMLEGNTTQTDVVSTLTESDRQRFEQAAQQCFGNVQGQTMTTIRLRLPDIEKPVNIRLSANQTLNDIRHLLCNTIEAFQITPFEFMVLPNTKITLEEEKETLSAAHLTNAAIRVRKLIL